MRCGCDKGVKKLDKCRHTVIINCFLIIVVGECMLSENKQGDNIII